MPKSAISTGLEHIINDLRCTKKVEAVFVPTANSKPCRWYTKAKGYKRIPFDVLLDVVKFALDNTIIKDRKGNLLNQHQGIPMGDPHSPGMTIGACAWMEMQWNGTLDARTKEFFRAKRYMDDILLLYAQNPVFNHTDLLHKLDTCYHPPLKLEEATPDTFLETTFEITDNKIRHWLKNDNDPNKKPKIWRYAHFKSHMAYEVKRGILNATLKKVHAMASDRRALYHSALQKIAEFKNLGYLRRMVWTACTTRGVQTRETTWFDVRDEM